MPSSNDDIITLKLRETSAVKPAAKKGLELLLNAPADDTASGRKKSDSIIKEFQQSVKGVDIAVVGKLSAKDDTQRSVELHMPLEDGWTLTMAITPPSSKPPVFIAAGSSPKAFLKARQGVFYDGGQDAGTIKYWWTPTQWAGNDDQQQDTGPD